MIFLDYETRSFANLKEVGGLRYSLDPTTEIVCIAAFDGMSGEWFEWKMGDDPEVLSEFAERATGRTLAAHHAAFDRAIWENVMRGPKCEWVDTVALARRDSLPGGLDALGECLFARGKDDTGQRAMRTAASPRKQRDGTRKYCTPKIDVILRYCRIDVEIMVAAYVKMEWGEDHIDDPVLEAHEKINARGVPVDLDAAENMIRVEQRLVKDAILRSGKSEKFLRTHGDLLPWLHEQGHKVPNVTRDTLLALLESGVGDEVERVIRGRFAVAKVTGGKARAVVNRAVSGRLYNSLVYHKAHTGRWAGSGLQPHNLPRGVMPPGFEWTNEHLAPNLYDVVLDYSKKHNVEPSAILGSMLRGLIVGDPLAVADWSQIEARIVQWISGGDLTPFVEGRPYEEFASKYLFGVPVEEITKTQRGAGKVAVLGAAYGIGGKKLDAQAKGQGVDFASLGLTGQKVVNAWRDANPWIAGKRTGEFWESPEGIVHPLRTKNGLWKALESAFKDATIQGMTTEVGKCIVRREGGNTLITLPSGRSLIYRNAKMERAMKFGRMSWDVRFDSPKGYREGTYGGKLTENCLARETQVVCRRGIIPLRDVLVTDEVWDGRRWVHHRGVVNKGIREVGEWLGVRLTWDHRIFDGKNWVSAIAADADASLGALGWARGSALGRFLSRESVIKSLRSAVVTAGGRRGLRTDACGEEPKVNAETVDAPDPLSIPLSSPIPRYDRCGPTATPEWCPAATTRTAKPTLTMEGGGSSCSSRGEKTAPSSSATQRQSTGGTSSGLIWTGLTTTDTMNRETYVSSPGERTAATDVWVEFSEGYPSQNSENDTAPSGRITPFPTTLIEGVRQNGCWRDIGRREEVFDLLDCGPNRRFTIITDYGPVVVHNCSQAIGRDILGHALVECEKEGIPVVMHVHDEIIAESDRLDDLIRIMTTPPEWAEGLPLDAEGRLTKRYTK